MQKYVFADCREPADIVFAIDDSGSINKENFEKMVDFVREFIQGLRIGDAGSQRASRVGMLTFSDRANILFHLNEYKTKFSILNAMPPYYSGGKTNTADALRVMHEEMFTSGRGDQNDVANIAIVLTDGRSNDEQETWQQAVKAREKGIHVIPISVGTNFKQSELDAMASYPTANNIYKVTSFDTLRDIRDRILRAVCNSK